MNPIQLMEFLLIALQQSWAILLQSSPGCGKSDIVTQVAHKLGFDLMICHPVTDDPTDAKGLPATHKGANGETLADFIPYGNLRRMKEAIKPLIVFLDDLGQASQAVQAAYMQLLLAREINGQKISPHVRFIAATNRRADNAGVSGLITPLISRFYATLELVVSPQDWIKWAMGNKLPMELIAFINLRPAMLNTFDPKQAKEGKPFACPRTVAFLGNILAEWNAQKINPVLPIMSGCVGEAFATEFNGFLQIYRSVGTLPQQIILNPASAQIPQAPDVLFALAAALSYHATPKNIDAIGQYYLRAENSQEMRVFFWKAATARKPELIETDAHSQWAIQDASAIA